MLQGAISSVPVRRFQASQPWKTKSLEILEAPQSRICRSSGQLYSSRNQQGMRQVLKRICFFFLRNSLETALLAQSMLILMNWHFLMKTSCFDGKIPPAVGCTLLPGGAAAPGVSWASKLRVPMPGERGPTQSTPGQGPRAAFKADQDRRGALLQSGRSFFTSPAARCWKGLAFPFFAC